MASNKVVDFLLILSVEILKFVQSSKFDDIEAIWCQNVRLTFEQIFRFETQVRDQSRLENDRNVASAKQLDGIGAVLATPASAFDEEILAEF
ncbi:hypothetical protein DdX_14500 [Ditylenchus destructor]|uniref:Uncharacterized protein n=1 Tax=Ditylenchus destructor TaxID=166010 RepID=A0AAD4MUG9_9BILA|nr:hypothetical protein DdX_14500 [Ditylenchus destructor]